jgi:radical SAM superfamily enzyme
MCEILASYNFKESIKWGGQFIFRDRKTVKPEHFEMIAAAGGDTFYVGVETGCDRIRKEMGKNFTNDDIEYQLEQFNKNNLKCTFLMFPGYVTESYEDHLDTIAMFKRWQKYVATDTINSIELGFPLIIMEKTPLASQIHDMQLNFLSHENLPTNHLWISKLNPTLDFVERVRRQVELYEEAIKYKWPIWRFSSRAEELKVALEQYYKIKTNNPNYKIIDIKVRND